MDQSFFLNSLYFHERSDESHEVVELCSVSGGSLWIRRRISELIVGGKREMSI